MKQSEVLTELNEITALMKTAEMNNDTENANLAIDKVLSLLREVPLKDSMFENSIIDIFKNYNSLHNTDLYLRQRRKEMSEAYTNKDITTGQKIMNEILEYQKNNKLNILETKIVDDIKLYFRYVNFASSNE